MKISRNWLQDYVDLTGLSDEQISEAITFLGFEVEGIESTGAPQLEMWSSVKSSRATRIRMRIDSRFAGWQWARQTEARSALFVARRIIK